jgi:hypothetical protein
MGAVGSATGAFTGFTGELPVVSSRGPLFAVGEATPDTTGVAPEVACAATKFNGAMAAPDTPLVAFGSTDTGAVLEIKAVKGAVDRGISWPTNGTDGTDMAISTTGPPVENTPLFSSAAPVFVVGETTRETAGAAEDTTGAATRFSGPKTAADTPVLTFDSTDAFTMSGVKALKGALDKVVSWPIDGTDLTIGATAPITVPVLTAKLAVALPAFSSPATVFLMGDTTRKTAGAAEDTTGAATRFSGTKSAADTPVLTFEITNAGAMFEIRALRGASDRAVS